MNTRLEIILEVGGQRFYLDTQGIETIPLTFNIANIKDISTTNGSFSKSIVIPETPNNRQVFNNISDLNSVSTFNPNKRNRAYILVDSQMIIEGYFQLTDIGIDHNDNKNSITLVIFTDNNDFYTVLADDYIDQLDLSRFDHIWSEEVIKYSWTQSFTNGFYYPLIDYGNDWTLDDINGTNPYLTNGAYVNTKNLYPAIYARTIWDQIFTEAGFSWVSKSLTQSTPFDNLIVPFNAKDPGVSQTYLDTNVFQVGLSQSLGLTTSYWYCYDNASPSWFYQPSSWGSFISWGASNDPDVNPSAPSGTITQGTRVKFDNESNPNDDSNNLWNTTLFEYTNTSGFPITERFGFYFKISQLFYYSQANPPYLQLKRSRNPITGATVSGGVEVYTSDQYLTTTNGHPSFPVTTANSLWQQIQTAGYGQAGEFQGGYGPHYEYEILECYFHSPSMQLYAGEKVWVEYFYPLAGPGGNDYMEDIQDYWSYPNSGPIYRSYLKPGLTVSIIDQSSIMYNEVSQSSNINQPIAINSCIPKKIKKRDFILSLIKMFNLVIEPNKDFPNTLNVETRDYYYSTGAVKDWSKKIDHLQPIEVQILGETQNKRTKFKYKDDKDYYNKNYTDLTQQSYGEYSYITENEFVDGEKKVEIIFSPTPVASLVNATTPGGTGGSASSIVLPKIYNVNNNKAEYAASNIRILQKKYITNLTAQDRWSFNNSANYQYGYPYAGHYDDPYNPTIDINFGQTQYLYYPQTVVTNNNLITKYWEKMLNEISDTDSRIVSVNMYLDPFDIINFRFNDNIYLDFGSGGQYYKVNKIEGYDPTTIRTCRVELIKTKEITVRKDSKYTRGLVIPFNPILSNPIKTDKFNTINATDVAILGRDNTAGKAGTSIVGNSNSSNAYNTVINGSYNSVASNESIINGSYNIIDANSPNNIILGSSNSVYNSSNIKVFGDNNTFQPIVGTSTPITNVTVIGNDMTVTNSDSVNISGVLVVNTNFVSAGRDEILDPFFDNSPVNYISGSRDSIRDIGSFNNISIISAGRDTII